MSGLFRKRLISGVLTFTLVFSLLPSNVFAEDMPPDSPVLFGVDGAPIPMEALSAGGYMPYGDLPKEIIIKDSNNIEHKFYDIYDGSRTGRNDTSNELGFFSDVLTKHEVLANWAGLAYNIFKDNPGSKAYTSEGKSHFDALYGVGKQYDLVDALVNRKAKQRTMEKDEKSVFKSSGLSVAYSLKDVEYRTGEMLAELLSGHIPADDFVKHNPVDVLNNDTKQTVLYTMSAGFDHHGVVGSRWYDYALFGMAFYDFKLSVIIDDKQYNLAYGDMDFETAIENQNSIPGFSYVFSPDASKTNKSNLTNDTGMTATKHSTLSATESIAATNSITNSSTFTFQEKIDTNVGFELKFAKVGGSGSVTIGFTAGQAIETAYNKSTTATSTSQQGSGTDVPLPPYTGVDVLSNGGVTVMKTSYDCPISISYKVALFSMHGRFADRSPIEHYFPAAIPQITFYTVFGSEKDGSDAITNLYNRALTSQIGGYDATYGNTKLAEYGTGGKYKKTLSTSLNWDNMKLATPLISQKWNKLGRVTDMAKRLTEAKPMSVTGGEMTQTINETTIEIKEIMPLYPLWRIVQKYDNVKYAPKVGETIRLDQIELTGLNEKGAPYYGFENGVASGHGTWRLVDEDGGPLDSSIASISTNAYGHVKLTAAGPGKGYITYNIDDDYYYYSGSDKPTSSESVIAPLIEFNVEAPPKAPFTGTVEATGEITVTVGADPVNINEIDTVEVTVYDSRGRELDVDVVWGQRESSSKGILVEDNMIRVTKAGTFHVDASYEDAHSDWITVTALPAPINVDHALLTRGDVAIHLHELAGNERVVGETGFRDVDFGIPGAGEFYKQAVTWLVQNDIASGITEDYFGANELVTKEQFYTILYNFAKYLGVDPDGETDQQALEAVHGSNASSWAWNAVAWGLSRGFASEADLADMKGAIYLDYADDIIDTVFEEGAALHNEQPPEDVYAPPKDEEDLDAPPEGGEQEAGEAASEEDKPADEEAAPEDGQATEGGEASGENQEQPGDESSGEAAQGEA